MAFSFFFIISKIIYVYNINIFFSFSFFNLKSMFNPIHLNIQIATLLVRNMS